MRTLCSHFISSFQTQSITTGIETTTTVQVSHIPGKKKRSRKHKKSDASSTTSDDHSSKDSRTTSRRKAKKVAPNQPVVEMTEEEKSRYVAMDCEMVGVGCYGQHSALAQVCLINWNGKKLYDVFVRPQEAVTDYRTFVSGITEQDLESDKAMDLDECRARVTELLQGKILVGHALKNDLHALGISHPWYDTRDTGKYEPFMKVRFDDGILWPRKLKELAKEKLGRNVQRPGVPHSPFEDAKIALDLYKVVRRKWEKAMDYKIKKTREIEQSKGSSPIVEADVQLAQ